jgi:hypothetical protein
MASGRFVNIVLTAYQDRLAFILIASALLAGGISLRYLSRGRRWFEPVAAFLLMTVLFTALWVLGLQLVFGVPVTGIEVVSFQR